MHPISSVDALVALLAGAGSGSGTDGDAGGGGGGEALDQLAHALQCADVLAARHPEDPGLLVAGLVHDVGHLLDPGDDAGHGRLGAAAVQDLLGTRVARLVELHVPAKRYLVATEPSYAERLSPVSTITLARQGGAMTPDEVAALRDDPDLPAALALRIADEAAKEPGRVVPGLDRWRPVLDEVARAATA